MDLRKIGRIVSGIWGRDTRESLSRFFSRNNVAWLTIDSYNDTLIGSADQVSRFGATNPNFSTIGGMEAEAQSAADAHDDVTRLRLDELWAKLKDSRYSPLGVFKAPQEKLTSEGWATLAMIVTIWQFGGPASSASNKCYRQFHQTQKSTSSSIFSRRIKESA